MVKPKKNIHKSHRSHKARLEKMKIIHAKKGTDVELHDIHTKIKKLMDEMKTTYITYTANPCKQWREFIRIAAKLKAAEARSSKPEAKSQKKPEARSQKKPKARSQKKPKARSQKPKARSQKPKARSQKPKARSQKQKKKRKKKRIANKIPLHVHFFTDERYVLMLQSLMLAFGQSKEMTANMTETDSMLPKSLPW